MPASQQPNILFVFTDQQNASMLSCAGNSHFKTPTMDRIAAQGTRFERAYCTAPVCMPSRFSLMTGRMPSDIRLKTNDTSKVGSIPEAIKQTGLGRLLSQAGYESVYAGKNHLPLLSPEDLGFRYLTPDDRDVLASQASEFIRQKHAQPFFLVASFMNPHDICYMAIRDFPESSDAKHYLDRARIELKNLDRALALPPGISEDEFFQNHCPPLPENFEPQADEPEAIQSLLTRRPFKMKARKNYTDKQWRLHRWAYGRLTESVDAQIAHLYTALEESGELENTVVIFSSDHGDMDAAHRMEHKTAFYEESARIPLLISQPGTTSAHVDSEHVVSNGLDLFPTICDFAGVKVPAELKGRSFRPLVKLKGEPEGRTSQTWRDAIPLESEIGRMVVSKRFKYMRYDEGAHREQLMDLQHDPGEMRNAAHDPDMTEVLKEHQRLFTKWFGED